MSRVRERAKPEAAKSVSNERTFAHDLTTREDVAAAVRMVSQMVGTRLRSKGLRGHQVTLKLKFSYDKTRTAQRQLDAPTDDEHVFGAQALRLLDDVWHEGPPGGRGRERLWPRGAPPATARALLARSGRE